MFFSQKVHKTLDISFIFFFHLPHDDVTIDKSVEKKKRFENLNYLFRQMEN